MSEILWNIFRNIKRLKKIRDQWKVASISLIFKKGQKSKVGNYRFLFLLKMASKVSEEWLYEPLRYHFRKHLSTCPNGFLKERSVATNMVGFLHKIYQVLNDYSNEQILALYTDYLKAFHEVPHFELIKKVSETWAGGCLIEVQARYLDKRKQFLRVDNVSTKTLDISSGVPQSFLLGRCCSGFFWMIFQHSSSLLIIFFAYYLKLLAHRNLNTKIHSDLKQVARWLKKSKIALAPNLCSRLVIKLKNVYLVFELAKAL